jgi:hypothetical protein
MKKRLSAVLLAAVTALTMVGIPTASAVRSYANCDQLHQRWQYGVAKSRKAARRQVRTGHYKPHVSRKGYRANRDLDADSDGRRARCSGRGVASSSPLTRLT